ncbi:hypothetical protein [Magnetospirillum sp. UT-4]|uniref:hypothetical protein n=1 Tax=Magnetospirillum sp. UT-4 TaxID=2681467 RepID=UPI00137DCFC9|nr:hypothetical protein [Magnetospirillum sp. UT-4]CAA7616909.1 hypothetical protein MTBUT4_240041 [Magnetospirillum sp. UT-4]
MPETPTQGTTSSESMSSQQYMGQGAGEQGGTLVPGEAVPTPAASHSGIPAWGFLGLLVVVALVAVLLLRWGRRL